MININKLDKISYTNKIVQIYEELNTEIVKDIIKRLKNTGDLSSFTKHQIRVITKQGGKDLLKETLNKSNRFSKQRKKELLNLFESVIKEDLREYKELYDYRDLDFKLTPNQVKMIQIMATITDKELKNYTKTIAFNSQKEYVKALDSMYKQVISGGIDIKTAFRKTTNNLAKKGITLTMKDGRERSIEASVRQSVLYGVRKSAQLVENDLIKYLGADAVEINITPNCRHEHQPINGKIFSLDKNNKSYPYFSKQYRNLLEDFGCQHYTSPFIIGVSEPIYTDKQVKEADSRTITYKGNKLPYYDATQKQRALERGIRNAKKTYMSNPTSENKVFIRNEQLKLRKFLKETGLTRDYDREYYAGYNN